MTKSIKRACLVLLMSVSATTIVAAEIGVDAPARASAASRLPWSWQPVKAPATPAIAPAGWARTPIDVFISATLAANGLDPSPDADRATFIRRATLDVLGLIPSPAEVDAFVADTSPDAYEKLVDRLLASPHYGERQARRWLDLARYADSSGFQVDTTRPNLYRYRDYVIDAFNQDKPYSRFIQEQIAGDELAPGDETALVATGFLTSFPDNSNSRDLIQRRYQIITDITDTIGTTILGTTVGCARCHNHKSDKLTQKDYFSLQAFFANTSIDEKIPATRRGDAEREFETAQAKWEETVKDIKAKQKEIIDSVREKALVYHKERYLTDSRQAIFKPEKEWTALDRWVNHRVASVTDDEALTVYLRFAGDEKESADYKANAEKWERYKKLSEELKKFDKQKPVKGSLNITAVTELGRSDSPPTHIYFGGNHERPLEEVQPAFPEALSSEAPTILPTATSSGRRLALANWLVGPSNPLTARVYVNRVWNDYFGKGIVGTVSDFGKAGDKPTHPELLDYLADRFVKDGWSVKKLHREILLSSVYRQSSAPRDDVTAKDSGNKLLAVFPRKRLDAEQIRDSLLIASGKLEGKIGGPSVYAPLPKGVDGGENFQGDRFWRTSEDPRDHHRRSLYVFARRSVPYPLLDTFDMANTQQAHSKRDVTTTPLQALALINSDQVFQWSQALAGRVIREAGEDETARLERLYQILFSRKPDQYEQAALREFLNDQPKIVPTKVSADGKLSLAVPVGSGVPTTDPLRASAFVDLVHSVVNSNEFIYRF